MPVCFWVGAGVRVSFTAVAMVKAVNTAGIVMVIMLNLYAFVMVLRWDFF